MRKSHPIRRFVLATAATVSGVVLLLALKPAADPAAASAAGAAPQATAGQQAPQGGTQPVGAAGATGSTAGTVTGDATQTQYGTVQVRLTVAGGKITKAEAVQAPKGGLSDQKTALAVPKLNQEAVAAQSAQIDAVSGATYTSNGYKKSLQSALDRMKSSAGSRTGAAGRASAGASGSGTSGSSATAQSRTLTGKVAQTQYGPVQVRITVSGGKITEAEAVQAPKGGLSDQKTALAVPRLNQEAVTAGTANIDAVSGATYTSTGYKQSLQSALDQAGG
ncbi:Na(+)-translocating NADH-quinone reductase subunit C [Streptomyces sp. RB17]|uniref:FMN-binding protein n=1 Tax=Streptomyces sp. RB17 TaxID=2585197 RepID=UPI001294EF24|nr:FMN-binding protein [Streptomyces sp. RB17]MQY38997.1 Na(+)-translocating NADH-quinone reductase subunit C [Streptomyces sp. RB17]